MKFRAYAVVSTLLAFDVNAGTCDAINEAVVNLETYSVGYSSWVEAPLPGEQLFKYSRCVRTLNGNWFDFDWAQAGLKGRVKENEPAFFQYVFFRELTRMAEAELRFGRSTPLENLVMAGFLQNEAESGGYAMVDAYIDDLSLRNVVAVESGSTLDRELVSIVSEASLLIPIDGDIEARLDLSFSSSIRGFIDGETSLYTIEYSFDGADLPTDVVVTLKPRSEFLRGVLFANLESPALDRSGEKQIWRLRSPVASEYEKFPRLSAVAEIIDVEVNEEIAASFPVTLYIERFN
jgi:hypothetical protein